MTPQYDLSRKQKIHRHLFGCDTVNILESLEKDKNICQSYLSKGCWVKRKDSGPSHVLGWSFHSMGSLTEISPKQTQLLKNGAHVPFLDSK